jgi:hypothetical protein
VVGTPGRRHAEWPYSTFIGKDVESELNMADEKNYALTPEQMAARIAELEGRLAKGGDINFKVSEKGAVSAGDRLLRSCSVRDTAGLE